MQVQDLVNLALKDIGVIDQGGTPSTDESNDAFATLNQILSSWSLEGKTVATTKVGTFAITAGVSDYTVGPGGMWSTTARPVKVESGVASSGAMRSGFKFAPMADFHASIQGDSLGISSAVPSKGGADNAAPLVNVSIWPTPSMSATIRVAYWEPIAQFSALTDVINFPTPGYELALRLELAVTLAPAMGRPVTTELAANMQRAKQRIFDLNASAATPQQPGA